MRSRSHSRTYYGTYVSLGGCHFGPLGNIVTEQEACRASHTRTRNTARHVAGARLMHDDMAHGVQADQ
eukprot:10832344-Alexandrium_andersonii.AAC.1